MSDEHIIQTTGLNNCGGRCLINVHLLDGQIVKLTTETPADSDSKVPLCACLKGLNYHKTFLNSDRILYPMKRIGARGEGHFQRISWEEAVDTITAEWIRIRDTYGPGSRYVNYATGMSGVLSAPVMAKRLLALDGGYLDRYNSYSTACISQATALMYGTTATGNSPESWLSSKLIILWGHNPAETHFDSITMHYLKKARAKGIPIIVIDPRKSKTVQQLDAEWIPIRPATDAALHDAMAYVIYSNGLHDQEFLDRCCLGFDDSRMPDVIDPSECYLDYMLGRKDGIAKTPEWAETITGISAEVIRSLAFRYAQAKPAALIQGYGAQRHAYGEQGARGAILLACMTGNVGIWGGWSAGNGYCEVHERPSFPIGRNPFPMSIPAYSWTEAVVRGHEMTELDGVRGGDRLPCDIKMILNLAGNCLINQHGDINRTSEILKDTSKCEFIVCSDLFMTSSAKFADILLPGVSPLERNDISMPWQYGEFLGFARRAIEPLGESRLEYDWLAEVAKGLGLSEEFTEGCDADEWLRRLYNDLRLREIELPSYEEFSRGGVFHYRNNPPVIAFAQQVRDPANYPFPTESGKIEIFSPTVYRTGYHDFFPAIPRYVEPPEGASDPMAAKYPLQLIGWHAGHRTHSMHDNNSALRKAEPQQLYIHPVDADARGLKDGETVLIWNDRGSIRIPVRITDDIMPGVTALAQGAWYSADETGADTAGCINTLTCLRPTPYARGNPQHTILVEVRKA